jgi:hypothetical protein
MFCHVVKDICPRKTLFGTLTKKPNLPPPENQWTLLGRLLSANTTSWMISDAMLRLISGQQRLVFGHMTSIGYPKAEHLAKRFLHAIVFWWVLNSK